MMVSHEAELHEARSIYFYFIRSEIDDSGCFVQLGEVISA
jgi:hypothetical protein